MWTRQSRDAFALLHEEGSVSRVAALILHPLDVGRARTVHALLVILGFIKVVILYGGEIFRY